MVPLVWIILFALVAVLVVLDVSADNHRYDNDEDSVVFGDTVLKSKGGVSVSGGDMEINECVSSFSWLFGIVQEVRTNPLCVAKQLEAEGKYEAAAELRCSVRRVRKVYGNREKCVAAVIFIPPPEPAPVVKTDDWYAELIERLDKVEAERQQASRSYARQQQVQQQQYERVQEIEDARQKRIDLIKQEFGSEEATTANN